MEILNTIIKSGECDRSQKAGSKKSPPEACQLLAEIEVFGTIPIDGRGRVFIKAPTKFSNGSTLTSLNVYTKTFYSEREYDALIMPYSDWSKVAFHLEGGKYFIIEFGIKYPSGKQVTLRLPYDLRGEMVKVEGIDMNLYGKEALSLRDNPLLKFAGKRVGELNALVPKDDRVKSLDIFTPLKKVASNRASEPVLGTLFILSNAFTSYKTYHKNLIDLNSIITHEFGHLIFTTKKLSEDPEWQKLFENVKASGLIKFFKDSDFTPLTEDDWGHPWDNETELFASVFMISTNHPEALKRALQRPDLSKSDKEIFIKIINFVYMQSYGKNLI
jgi:hypothetical protein